MKALDDNEVLVQRNQRVSISSQQSTSTTQTAAATSNVDLRKYNQQHRSGLHGLYMRLDAEYRSIPWDRLKSIKWKNERASAGKAYQPTEIEHIANILSHGIWVIPAFYAAFQLLWRSYSPTQIQAASIYGATLASLFTISTCFHGVCYCDRHRAERNLKVVLHRCDRAMIYVFIAGSYFPWLSLGDPAHPVICRIFKWAIWILAALGILYQQLYHERYKTLETIFYVIMGLGPSTVIMLYGHEFEGMVELKLGGLLYMIGIGFFKSDGILPFAHSIWHIFVVMAVSVHYFAILTYLYPSSPPVN